MKSRLLFISLLLLTAAPSLKAEPQNEAIALMTKVGGVLLDSLNPSAGTPLQTTMLEMTVTSVEGLPGDVVGKNLAIALRGPDHFRMSVVLEGREMIICQAGPAGWIYEPSKKFGLQGSPDLPRFSSDPRSISNSRPLQLKLPLDHEQLPFLAALVKAEIGPEFTFDSQPCRTLTLTPAEAARQAIGLPFEQVAITLGRDDNKMHQLGLKLGGGGFTGRVTRAERIEADDPSLWKMPSQPGDHVEKVAQVHLQKFLMNLLETLQAKIPTLGPPNGEKKLLATEGKGRLEQRSGTRVLFLKGTPAEMGRQHGTLLKKEVQSLVSRVLYGVGVGSSFAEGRWFFGTIEQAQKQLLPHMDPRHLEEMDAMAAAAELHPQELRLANFFPELFHCSGFALGPSVTSDGQVYHGRVLDYLKGQGLEQNAAVIVMQPDKGNAWVNCGYAGFVGSVTAMNEKGVAIGEMGGGGEGQWNGKPMAALMRECMEKADTMEQAVEIMRKGPRTCEYYYVISDGKSGKAVGIAATPDKFEVISMGEAHPKLPSPVNDTVLMSAGDRYTELARRVHEGTGKFTAESALELMSRPVCMTSNIQSVLFAPKSLDFWVANADSKNVASHTRFTKYNLRELLGK